MNSYILIFVNINIYIKGKCINDMYIFIYKYFLLGSDILFK